MKSWSKLFNLNLEMKGVIERATFQGVCVDDIPLVEDLIQVNIFLYGIDIVDGSFVGELARRSVQKYCNTVRLLRYNDHICYVSNINALFKAYRCSFCNQFFNKTGNLERHLVFCKDRIKHVFPRNVYQLGETLFDKLDFFSIPYTKEQQLFKNLAVLDFESTCEHAIFAVLNERREPRETVLEFGDECLEVEEKDVSTQFLQMQKNQILDLQEHLERYCNVLPVFGFNSSKDDINLIKRYLLPLLVNERVGVNSY